MANQSSVDVSGWLAGLEGLYKIKTSLARSMAVAGGQVLRDEAKRWAPVGDSSKTPGLLKSAIYLAFKEAKSTDEHVTYSVSWNGRKAPHGHLVEFGHWQKYAAVRLPNGDWITDVSRPLPAPKWVAAKPFLRPAFDVGRDDANRAMIQRGKERLPELLRDLYNDSAEFV